MPLYYQGCHFTWKHGKTWNLGENNLEFEKKKTWNFEHKPLKNLRFFTIFISKIVSFQFETKNKPYK